MIEQDKTCANCKWYEPFVGVCFNGYSLRCADFVDDEYYCAAWEGKSGED